jgi:hypothetical protein
VTTNDFFIAGRSVRPAPSTEVCDPAISCWLISIPFSNFTHLEHKNLCYPAKGIPYADDGRTQIDDPKDQIAAGHSRCNG